MMMLLKANKLVLSMAAALLAMLAAGGSAEAQAQAQDIVYVDNPTAVTVSYDYKVNGGGWMSTSLAPNSKHYFRTFGNPMEVRYYSGAAFQHFALSARRGRVAEYFFVPIAGGGIDLYGPRNQPR